MEFLVRLLLVLCALGAAAAIYALLVIRLRWWAGPRCKYSPNLEGRVAVITGANGGLGRETALQMARLGASIVLLDRDVKRSQELSSALETVVAKGATCESVECDLADLTSVRIAAVRVLAKHGEIHYLFNNAAVMAPALGATRQGWETQYGINHLGHVALTVALMPSLEAGNARVICLSSSAHLFAPKCGIDFDRLTEERWRYYDDFNTWRAHGQSKLAVVLFAKELQRRYGDRGVAAFSVHPGAVHTGIGRHVPLAWLFYIASALYLRTPEEGVQTQLECAFAPMAELEPGGYHSDCSPWPRSPHFYDDALSAKLWDASIAQVEAKHASELHPPGSSTDQNGKKTE